MFGNHKALLQEENATLRAENERLKAEFQMLQSKVGAFEAAEENTQKTLSENRLKTALVQTMLGGCGNSVKEI